MELSNCFEFYHRNDLTRINRNYGIASVLVIVNLQHSFLLRLSTGILVFLSLTFLIPNHACAIRCNYSIHVSNKQASVNRLFMQIDLPGTMFHAARRLFQFAQLSPSFNVLLSTARIGWNLISNNLESLWENVH